MYVKVNDRASCSIFILMNITDMFIVYIESLRFHLVMNISKFLVA